LSFLDINSFNAEVGEIGNFRVHFENLFGGNKAFEDSANELFNTIWREMFEVLRPAISTAFDTLISNHFKKIFEYVPFDYLVADLP